MRAEPRRASFQNGWRYGRGGSLRHTKG